MAINIWVFFKAARILIFSLSALISLTWAIFLSILLGSEWHDYNTGQRAIVLGLAVVNGITSIMLYLMIVLRFRLWLDAARVGTLLVFQIGSTVVFILFSPSLPCNAFGSTTTCKLSITIITIGCCVVSGLLLFYAVCLTIMSRVPLPKTRPNPEAALTTRWDNRFGPSGYSSSPSLDSDTRLLRQNSEKRQSVASASSTSSFGNSGSLSDISAYTFVSPQRTRDGEYFGRHIPRSPSSVSVSSSSTARSYRSYRRPSTPSLDIPGSLVRPQSPHPSRELPRRPLPNPFADPTRTPIVETYGYGFSEKKDIIDSPDRAIAATVTGLDFPPPPYLPSPTNTPLGAQYPNYPADYSAKSYLAPPPPAMIGYPSVPGTVISMRPAPATMPPRQHTATPGALSVRSMAASLHMLDRQGSVSAAPLTATSLGGFSIRAQTPVQLAVPSHPGLSNLGFGGTQPAAAPIYRHDRTAAYVHAAAASSPAVQRGIDYGQWRQEVLKAASDAG